MSLALHMALNRSLVSYPLIAQPSDHCFVRSPVEVSLPYAAAEMYSLVKSTSSKQRKRVVNQSSASAVNECEDDEPVARQSGNFPPSVWGDFFLAYEAMEPLPEEEKKELKQLRDEIIMLLKRTPDKSFLKLDLIDNIQRLGVSYQFEEEIEASLANIRNSFHEESQNDLHTAALCFRLLRQQGHRVSSDVLKKFKNRDGEFEAASLANDIRGLLSLYEASYYAVHGENILDEALKFTTTTLESMVNDAPGFVAKQIDHALTWPIRQTTNRVMARKYISLYQHDEAHNEALLRFSKLDFNRVQRIHQQELCGLTKWWKGIDCARKYPFVRDRLVENYFTALGLNFEPHSWLSRKFICMAINVLTITDDLYDVYGTIDELRLLTDAIQRWKIDAVNQLPPYMKPCYEFLLNCYTEIEEELAKHGRTERVQYIKAEMKILAKICYEEAYWNHTGCLPTFEQYSGKGALSNGMNLMVTSSYVGMEESMASKAVLDWSLSRPLGIIAGSKIAKLVDDIYDHEDTSGVTAVDCYMKQYDVSRQEAVEEIYKAINSTCKDINNESLLPTVVPLAIIEIPLNLVKTVFTMFKYGDGFTLVDSESTKLIKSIFVDPIM